jgi:DNA replication protein DnaC
LLDAGARHDLLELLEERYARKSLIITSQLPVDTWHDFIGDLTYADAILDRVAHNAHRINLSGHSLRRTRTHPKTSQNPMSDRQFIVFGLHEVPLRIRRKS